MRSLAIMCVALVASVTLPLASADEGEKKPAGAKTDVAKPADVARPADVAKPADVVKPTGEKPAASPGWVIVEEDWWYPLRLESLYSLNAARSHYRKSEEKAAADEIRKASSWLKYAAAHALPKTKKGLLSARETLVALAKDLAAGDTVGAARLNASMAEASRTLAKWHYFQAKGSYTESEMRNAALHLDAAVAHLDHAAKSSHYQYGPSTITLFEGVRENGLLVLKTETVDNNMLGKHLDGIDKAVKDLTARVRDASK